MLIGLHDRDAIYSVKERSYNSGINTLQVGDWTPAPRVGFASNRIRQSTDFGTPTMQGNNQRHFARLELIDGFGPHQLGTDVVACSPRFHTPFDSMPSDRRSTPTPWGSPRSHWPSYLEPSAYVCDRGCRCVWSRTRMSPCRYARNHR
jgi:hypothetical protein